MFDALHVSLRVVVYHCNVDINLRGISPVTSCVCVSFSMKGKMTSAINTKLGRHILYSVAGTQLVLTQGSEGQRSKVTGLSTVLPVWDCS